MAGGVDGHIGGQLAVVADRYLGHIQDGTVIIGKEVLSHLDVGAVVAVEGRIDHGILGFSQKLLDHGGDPLKVGPVHKIQLLQDSAGDRLLLKNTVI